MTRTRGAHAERYRVAVRRGLAHRAAGREKQPLVLLRPDAYRMGAAVAVIARIDGPQ